MIDIYTHILPAPFTAALAAQSAQLGNMAARLAKVAPLHDLDLRFRQMDAFPMATARSSRCPTRHWRIFWLGRGGKRHRPHRQ